MSGENIFGPLYNKVGEGWHDMLDTFANLIEWDMAMNKMPAVQITGLEEKRGQLRIYFNGGDARTDAYALFVRDLSTRTREDP